MIGDWSQNPECRRASVLSPAPITNHQSRLSALPVTDAQILNPRTSRESQLDLPFVSDVACFFLQAHTTDRRGSWTCASRRKSSRFATRYGRFSRGPARGHPPQDGARPAALEGRHRHLAAHPEQEGLGRAELAGRVGRHRLGPGEDLHLQGGDAARARARSALLQRQHDRPGADRVRHRGAEARISCRRVANLDYWFCQGFSEPGAGSDLASLKTSARLDGDHYVVNGQKIWTSRAQHADWMFCLVRTDAGAKLQRGISYLLIDMKTPGLTVRPILTIDGEHHFNEVFFDDVRVPAAQPRRRGEQGLDLREVPARQRARRHRPHRRVEVPRAAGEGTGGAGAASATNRSPNPSASGRSSPPSKWS